MALGQLLQSRAGGSSLFLFNVLLRYTSPRSLFISCSGTVWKGELSMGNCGTNFEPKWKKRGMAAWTEICILQLLCHNSGQLAGSSLSLGTPSGLDPRFWGGGALFPFLHRRALQRSTKGFHIKCNQLEADVKRQTRQVDPAFGGC